MSTSIRDFVALVADQLTTDLETLVATGRVQPNEFVLKLEVRNQGDVYTQYSRDFVTSIRTIIGTE